MLTIAILAGGKSQRIGRDKAFLPFLGRPLIRRVMDRLMELTGDMVIIAPRTDEYLALGVRLVPDLLPGRGSLGGLYTALASATHPLVAVVACDAPFISPALLAHERDLFASAELDAVVPSSPEGLEPLYAVYRRVTCLPAVRAALDAGEQRMIAWHPQARVRVLTVAETAAFDPLGRMFLNVNTPDDFALAERFAREE
jgi:molybdopterin-guanine dinucleotide biosynthesis protein A